MKALRVAALAFLTATLSGCIAVPRESPRKPLLEGGSLGLSQASEAPVDPTWWVAYGDPQLDDLMRRALADNPTLAEALARVRQAQAAADLAKAGLAPSVSYDAAETRQRFSHDDVIRPPLAGGMHWEGRQGLNLSWDLDFWGRQASLLRQARSTGVATDLDLVSARLALEGAISQAYVDLDRDFSLVEIAESSIAQRTQILNITRQRVRAGLDTNVELREAEGAVPQARVDLRQAQSDREAAIHLLAELTGRGAREYGVIQKPQWRIEAVLQLPKSLPANLLGRRPDVLAARSRVEGAVAGQAAAEADFYPDVNLAAFAGTAAIGLDNLFHANSGIYGAGPAIHLPVFDAGRLRARYRSASAEIDAAVAQYDKTVLQAVREVSDQLTRIDALADQLDQQRKSLDAVEAAYHLATERYQAGLSTYLIVLNAETEVLNARRQRVELLSTQVIARVSLLLAVGGSFDPGAPLPATIARN